MANVAILHQDLEWAEKQFQESFSKKKINVGMHDVRTVSLDKLLKYDLVINRVYASVANRNYPDNLRTLELLEELERNDILCLNSALTTRVDYFKDYAAIMQEKAGLITPKTRIFRNAEEAKEISEELGFPLIMKRNTGGRAVDLRKIDDQRELNQYLSTHKNSYGGDYILQEFLTSSLPYDYRVTIIENQLAFAYKRSLLSVNDGENPWLASVSKGSSRESCNLPEEVLDVALKGAKSINAFYDSMDIIVTEEGPAIIEHNPTPNYSCTPEEIKKSERFIDEVTDIISQYITYKNWKKIKKKKMIKLGFVAELDLRKDNPNYPVTKKQIQEYFGPLSEQGMDTYVFSWKNLTNEGKVNEAYSINEGKTKELDLNKELDIVYTKQLGNIANCPQEFLNYLTNLGNVTTIKVNEPERMFANLDKNYLIRLQKEGFPVVPTINVYNRKLEELLQYDFGTKHEDIILKPRVFGESGNGIVKLSDFENDEDKFNKYIDQNQPVIAQPMMEEIFKGERSLIFLGNEFSHGIIKKSATDNYKINISFGTEYARYFPKQNELEMAHKVIDYYNDRNQMTRIDFLDTDNGPKIMEVERINPSTYTTQVGLAQHFCDNLAKFLKRVYTEQKANY